MLNFVFRFVPYNEIMSLFHLIATVFISLHFEVVPFWVVVQGLGDHRQSLDKILMVAEYYSRLWQIILGS